MATPGPSARLQQQPLLLLLHLKLSRHVALAANQVTKKKQLLAFERFSICRPSFLL